MTRHNRFTLSALTIALSVSALDVTPTRIASAADAPASPLCIKYFAAH